jgi:hypothetical protein
MKRSTPIQIDYALAVIGLSKEIVDELFVAAKQDAADDIQCYATFNQSFQRAVKDARKKRLLEYHPDRYKGADAHERSVQINHYTDELLKLRFRPKPRPVALSPEVLQGIFGQIPVMPHFQTSTFTSSANTTTNSFAGTGQFVYFVNGRRVR